MKTKIVKIVFLMICIGLFVFLLLPFLETTSAPGQAQFKAQPQVTTDNPLTAIAKRLRNLFGHKERAHRSWAANPSQAGTAQVADEFLASAFPTGQTPNRPIPPFADNEQSRTIDVPRPKEPFDFGDASLQTDQGKWFLIRQTVPQSAQPGMHEINVHENPYDRYIKQERAQRALPQQPHQEIPDSKWARLVRPVKHFFGLDTPTPVGASSVSISHDDPHAPLLATAKESKQTSPKSPAIGQAMRLPWPDITPQQWEKMTPKERERETERRSVAQFVSLLSGEQAAEQAAEIAADTKFPNPKNKQEEQAKEEYKQQVTEQNKQIIKNGILQVMEQNASDKEPVDELSFMLGCKPSSLPNGADSCEAPSTQQQPPAHAIPPGALLQAQTQNAEKFFEITKYVLPSGLPITPVFGPTSLETIQKMTANPDPNIQKTGEIYEFLFNQQKCGERTCFWVPTSKQTDPQLTDAIKAMGPGSHLKADPLHRYEASAKEFVQYKVSQLPAGAPDEQKALVRKEALEQFEKNAAALVPYVEELKEVQDKTKNATDPHNKEGKTEDVAILHVTDPTQATAVAQLIDSVIFSYGQISLVNADDALEAATQMTTSRAYNVKDAAEVISNQVTQPAVSSALIQNLNQTTSDYNKAGAGWEGIFHHFKNK